LEELKEYEKEEKKQIKFNILEQYCNENKIGFNVILYNDINNLCMLHFGSGVNTLQERFKKWD
jgi:hypothetical protein